MSRKQKDIIVPEVAGKTVSEVVVELQELGFEVADETETISDSTIQSGRVVKVSPPSGAKRTPGTKVTIFVSSGSSKIEIEDYLGKNVFEVRGAFLRVPYFDLVSVNIDLVSSSSLASII